MTQTKTYTDTIETGRVRVALSNYHNGQIVQPKVTAKLAGLHRVTVTLSWFDHSDRTESNPKNFTGTVADAEKWLQSEGVRLDAQGICW